MKRKKEDKASSGSELINGRSMMTVATMYQKPDEEMPKIIGDFVREYSGYPERLRECLPPCVDVLIEGRTQRKQEVDDKKVERIRREIRAALKGIACSTKTTSRRKPSTLVSEDSEPSPLN